MTRSQFWRPSTATRAARADLGFTLTELAISLLIVGLLVGGVALTLTTQYEARQFSETQTRLDIAREALIGFAVRNGRLPCPAAPAAAAGAFREASAISVAGTGEEAFAAGGTSANGNCWQFHGLLPAMTLGAGPANAQGYLLDAWDTPIRYSVSSWGITSPPAPPALPPPSYPYQNIFTRSGGIAAVGVAGLSPPVTSPDYPMGFRVCSTTTCAAGEVVTTWNSVPAVVFSVGKNRRLVGHDADEAENFDNDAVFLSHEPRPTGAAGGEYDDIVTWLSVNILLSRMVSAGTL